MSEIWVAGATYKLKECPFCGKDEALDIMRSSRVGTVGVICNVARNGCGGSGAFQPTLTGAVDVWNTRLATS